MARVTVEDCLEMVENRFELVMVSSKRARQIATLGKEPMVPVENDKPTVIALREIAEGFVNASILKEPTRAETEASLLSAVQKGLEEQELGQASELPPKPKTDNP